MTVIDRKPLYCGPSSTIPEGFFRPHHLIISISDPRSVPISDDELTDVRRNCTDLVNTIEALWSPEFYKDWLLVWQGSKSTALSRTIAPIQSSRPVIIDGLTLVRIKKPGRGTYRYSELALEVQAAMAGQLYKADRLLAGANSCKMGVGDSAAAAQSVLLAYLEPVKTVLRRTGPQDEPGEYLFHKLRDDVGTVYIRELYGEQKKTSALKIGVEWFSLGRKLGIEHPEVEDTQHQIAEIAEELALLDNVIMLRLRAAAMEEATRQANETDLKVEPIPFEAASTIVRDRTGQKLYRRPDPPMMTKLAYNLNLDVTALYPNLAYMRPHIAAARAAGHFSRKGEFDEDPIAHWGLKALLMPEGDAVVEEGLRVARAYLRPLVDNALREWVLTRDAAPVLSALDLEKVRQRQKEG